MTDTDPKSIAASLTPVQACCIRMTLPKVGARNNMLDAAGVSNGDRMALHHLGLVSVYGIETKLTALGVRVHKALVSAAPPP